MEQSDNFARDVFLSVQELLREEHVETSLSCNTFVNSQQSRHSLP